MSNISQELLDETMHTLINKEVYANQTAIVNTMLGIDNNDLVQWDDVENLYYYINSNGDSISCDAYSSSDTSEDLSDYEEQQQEIMQWYSVSQWLADKLFVLGQPVIRLPNIGYWWGICNYGIPLEDQPELQMIVEALAS